MRIHKSFSYFTIIHFHIPIDSTQYTQFQHTNFI